MYGATMKAYRGTAQREMNMDFRSGHFLSVMHTYEYLKCNLIQSVYLLRI